MIRKNRTRQPEPDEDQAAVPEAVPDDLQAAAEEARRGAENVRSRASQGRTDAARVLAEAEQEAARLTAEARTKAASIVAESATADRQGDELEGRARSLDVAAREQGLAAAADRHVSDLETERMQLAEQFDDISGQVEQLDADRRAVEEQLATARANGDVDAISALLGRQGGLDDLVASRRAQAARAQARLAAIGDGEAIPGELADARGGAARHHGAVERRLRDVYPDSAQAVRYRALEELKGALEGNMERIAEEARRKPEDQRRTVVMQ